MNLKKKSQGAVEFILIFFFVLTIISVLIYILGLYSLDVQKQENEKEILDFVASINKEVLTLQNSQEGYLRTLEIPKYLMDRYDLRINSSFIIIRDIEHDGELGEPRFYSIVGDNKIKQTFNTTTNNSYLIFEKNINDNYQGIDLKNKK